MVLNNQKPATKNASRNKWGDKISKKSPLSLDKGSGTGQPSQTENFSTITTQTKTPQRSNMTHNHCVRKVLAGDLDFYPHPATMTRPLSFPGWYQINK